MCGAQGAPARARVERGRARVERGRARVERGPARVERGPARCERPGPWSRPGLMKAVRRMLVPRDFRLCPQALGGLPRGAGGRHPPRPRAGAPRWEARTTRPAPQGPRWVDDRLGGQDGSPGGPVACGPFRYLGQLGRGIGRGGTDGLTVLFAVGHGRFRVRLGLVHALVPGDGRLARIGCGGCEPLAGVVLLGVSCFRAGCGQVRLREAVRRTVGPRVQEPARRRRHPGPPVRTVRAVRRLGIRRHNVGFLACGRGDDQARRHRPGWHHAVRPDRGSGARMLRFIGRSGRLMTILTRVITFRVHHRPQFNPISGEMSQSSPIPTDSCGSSRVRCYPLRARVYRGLFFGAAVVTWHSGCASATAPLAAPPRGADGERGRLRW